MVTNPPGWYRGQIAGGRGSGKLPRRQGSTGFEHEVPVLAVRQNVV
jgi:hypothetical protein